MPLEGEKWELGTRGEDYVRNWLKRQGFYVVPTSLIENGGAPALEGWAQRHILPDIQAFGAGTGRWVEVKTKSVATFYRKTRTWEHGLPLRHWLAYSEVERETGLPAYLCVLEIENDLVLLARMAELARYAREYNGTNMPGGHPHIFFPRDRFQWHPQPAPLPLTPLPPKAARSLSQKHAPLVQQLAMDSLLVLSMVGVHWYEIREPLLAFVGRLVGGN